MSLYSTLLGNLLMPSYYRLQGRGYGQHRRFLEHSQWWTEDRLREYQWRQVKHLLHHAYQTVPWYSQKYDAAGIHPNDIRTLEDFAHLPPLTRAEVNEHASELCSATFRGKRMPHATGGSSGEPTRFFISIESYDWRTAASDRAYAMSGHTVGERTLFLWGAPIGQPSWFSRTKMRTYRSLRREFVIPTMSQSTDLWQRTAEAISRFQPRFVVGYVSSLDEFSRYLIGCGIKIRCVRAVIAAAEPVYESTREIVAQAFGADLFNTYGSREFMSIAAECPQHDGMHINAENVFVETEHPASAGPSELLVTDLHNFAMPFIRYRIGDVGTLAARECPCGRGLPVLQSVEGRTVDLLHTRDGRAVTGLFFPHLLKDLPEVLDYQVEQKSLDEIVISAVLRQPLTQRSATLVQAEVAKVFGNQTRVTIQPVGSIPRRASGKRRVTIGLQQSAGANQG